MSSSRSDRARFRSGFFVALVSALAISIVSASGVLASPTAPSREAPGGRALVMEVQQHLTSLGYDAGPVDGLLGGQTREAIREFETGLGRAPTGEPSEEILQLLRRQDADASRRGRVPTASTEPTPTTDGKEAASTKPQPTLAGTSWEFQDENGADFTVSFEADGKVSGPAFSHGWGWEQDGNEVALTYDNRVGGQSTRTGRLLSGAEMAGVGKSSRGVEWTWRATRTR